MAVIAVVDSGPIFAMADARDRDHRRATRTLADPRYRLFLPVLVAGEVGQLIETRLGPAAEVAFLRDVGQFSISTPDAQDWQRIADLVDHYRDFPLGVVDASIVALAERLHTDLIITLDHRHFRAVRPRHVESFRLLPE